MALLSPAATLGCKNAKNSGAKNSSGGTAQKSNVTATPDGLPLKRTAVGNFAIDVLTEGKLIPAEHRQGLIDQIKERLARAEIFAKLGEPLAVPSDLRVSIGEDPTSRNKVEVLVEIVPSEDSDSPRGQVLLVDLNALNAESRDGDGGALGKEQALVAAVLSGVDGLIALERLRVGDPAEVLAWCSDPDPARREAAAEMAGERKIGRALDCVLKLLHDANSDVRDVAIGALVQIGDQSAVGPLTELAKFEDVDMLRRLLDAVASLGGEEAESYLSLVANGHENPAIQAIAQQALDRLKKKAKASQLKNQ